MVDDKIGYIKINAFANTTVAEFKAGLEKLKKQGMESLILDLLQGFAYENDRQVKEKHIYWGLDKENPRTQIKISEHSIWHK